MTYFMFHNMMMPMQYEEAGKIKI